MLLRRCGMFLNVTVADRVLFIRIIGGYVFKEFLCTMPIHIKNNNFVSCMKINTDFILTVRFHSKK